MMYLIASLAYAQAVSTELERCIALPDDLAALECVYSVEGSTGEAMGARNFELLNVLGEWDGTGQPGGTDSEKAAQEEFIDSASAWIDSRNASCRFETILQEIDSRLAFIACRARMNAERVVHIESYLRRLAAPGELPETAPLPISQAEKNP